VLGVSFDAPERNRAFAEKFSFPFRLLSDTSRDVALAYGAARSRRDRFPARYTYVIGPDGRIVEALDTKDPGAQAAELLARR
jgi:peroxiredoxin Q/BCP